MDQLTGSSCRILRTTPAGSKVLKGSKYGKTNNGRRRHLSAAAKKLISVAQKKRWAAQK
jgi:hypothetical protein